MKNIILLLAIPFMLYTLCLPHNAYAAFDQISDYTNYYAAMRKQSGKIAITQGTEPEKKYFDDVNGNGTSAKIEQIEFNQERYLRIISALYIINIIVLILLLLLILKTQRDKRIATNVEPNFNNSKRIADELELKNYSQNLNSNLNKLNEIIADLNKKLESLEDKMNKFQMSNLDTPIKERNAIITNECSENLSNDNKYIKYLKGKSGNKFKIITDYKDYDTFYCIDRKDNEGTFKFCGNVEKAIENFNAIFDSVCDYEGDSRDAKTITNIEPGCVIFSDGYWLVTKKAKIKVE